MILTIFVRCTVNVTAVQIYREQILADLFRPTSYGGSGSRGTMEMSRTAEAISDTGTLLATTTILVTIHSLSTPCSSALTETLGDFGSYLQSITSQVGLCVQHFHSGFVKLICKFLFSRIYLTLKFKINYTVSQKTSHIVIIHIFARY